MYNKEYYERNKEKLNKKNLDYYYAQRNNPDFMKRKRESDKKYYYSSKIKISKCITIETEISVSFL
jgi:hypothetical protein